MRCGISKCGHCGNKFTFKCCATVTSTRIILVVCPTVPSRCLSVCMSLAHAVCPSLCCVFRARPLFMLHFIALLQFRVSVSCQISHKKQVGAPWHRAPITFRSRINNANIICTSFIMALVICQTNKQQQRVSRERAEGRPPPFSSQQAWQSTVRRAIVSLDHDFPSLSLRSCIRF